MIWKLLPKAADAGDLSVRGNVAILASTIQAGGETLNQVTLRSTTQTNKKKTLSIKNEKILSGRDIFLFTGMKAFQVIVCI